MLSIEDVVATVSTAVATALVADRSHEHVVEQAQRSVRDALGGHESVALEVNGCHVWLVRGNDTDGEDYVQLCAQPAAGEDSGEVHLEGEMPGLYYPHLAPNAHEASAP